MVEYIGLRRHIGESDRNHPEGHHPMCHQLICLLQLSIGTDTSAISALRLMRVFRVIRLVGFLEKLNLLVQVTSIHPTTIQPKSNFY